MHRSIYTLFIAVLTIAGSHRAGAVGALPSPLTESPLFFEQMSAPETGSTKYFSRGPNYLFGISSDHAEIVLQKGSVEKVNELPGRGATTYEQTTVQKLRLQFLGANGNATVMATSELAGKVNYFIGNDPAQWRTALMFSQVRVAEVYPGISMVYYGNGRQFEYDFELQPGADPRQISIRVDGADKLRVDEQGDLVISLGGEEIRQAPPQIYQFVNGVKQPVDGRYLLKDEYTVQIAVNRYDSTIPLTIDPQLSYCSFFGGNFGDKAYAVKVDGNGFIYIAGQTLSRTFLFSAGLGYTNKFQGGKINGDAFVARFGADPSSPPLYFTFLGGSGDDGAIDLAIDSTMHAYITGFTASTNFPTWPTNLTGVAHGISNHISGISDPVAHIYPTDAFVTELDTTANGMDSLKFSAYIGGTRADVGVGIALNAAGQIYITGYTDSTNFPTFNGAQTNRVGTNDVFIAKIAADGSAVLYSSYLGGSNIDVGQGIAALGDLAFVTGYTASTNFPVTTNNALAPQINGSTNAAKQYKGKTVPLDAFIAEFDTLQSGTNSLVYCSYFGGSNSDAGYRIVVDASTNVYITGNTSSHNFPTNGNHVTITNGLASSVALNYDAILARFDLSDPIHPALVFSFPFGGTFDDVGWDLALDPDGDIFVVGVSTSRTNFPTFDPPAPLNRTNSGAADVFVAAFSTNATNLLYSFYLGGKSNDFGYGIAVDANKTAYIVGQTFTTTNKLGTNFPVTLNALQAHRNGTNDAFLAAISFDALPTSISSLRAVGANMVVTFTSPSIFDTTNNFMLESAGVMAGPYTNTFATFTGSSKSFQAVVPRRGNALMYRVKHVP